MIVIMTLMTKMTKLYVHAHKFFQIPFIKQAKQINPEVLFFGSPWSAPPWTKTNGGYSGRGSLKKKYYQLWADYFVK